MKKILTASLLAIAPVLAFAQNTTGTFDNALDSISAIRNIINNLIPLIIGIAVLVFIWGLVQYVTAGGDEEKRDAARGTIIWGIIIIFVMTAVWGFVRILGGTLFGGQPIQQPVQGPQV